MKYQIQIHWETTRDHDIPDLADIVRDTLDYEDAPAGEISLILTDKEHIQSYNRQFRGLDQPTDVLSFADGDKDADTGILYFGDIFIAIPVAVEQALELGHSLKSELTLLTVHGVLHLLGYDHENTSAREQMWSRQDEILVNLNCDIASPGHQQ